VGDRYELHEELGRGGMACVYRAVECLTGRSVALKQLTLDPSTSAYANAAALFEREFNILTQLRHPHVISVYDYGLRDDATPYYTMELLDGGDLRERAPLPWPQVCSLFFDVCSSLALLHSRRLLHRDISPRNIRCTHDGKAKLIDFGAMAPMSTGGGDVVGTPAFIAPETLHRLALDARTDLYSLGVTLYYALTARVPYSARTFAEVLAAWSGKVVAPSHLVRDIPAALDDLVMALISLEPALRPQSAFAVMQQLAACAGLPAHEVDAVSRAYLATPTLVGRAAVLQTLQQQLLEARTTRGAGIWLAGAPGVGRSRLLDACVLEAKTLGFTVLRATASGSRDTFGSAQRLTQQLLDALPTLDLVSDFPYLFREQPQQVAQVAQVANDNTREPAPSTTPQLKDFSDPALQTTELADALRRLLLKVSGTRPLLIAVDDVHRIDPPSAAVLAELSDKARRNRILLVLTADREADSAEVTTVLMRRCQALTLEPLTSEQTHALLGSLFGDVANLAMLASEIYKVALGNPRQCMDLAQHLVDKNVVRYAAGTWTLPQRLSNDDLPSSAAEAVRARIAGLSQAARFLAEAQALAFYETFTDHDYRALLPEASSLEIENALTELLAIQALVRDGVNYTPASRVWKAAFIDRLAADVVQQRHAALATLFKAKSEIALIHHSFAGGLCEQGLAALDHHHASFNVSFDHKRLLQERAGDMMWCFDLAIETAQRLGRGGRHLATLRQWQYGGSLMSENPTYTASAQLWFEQLAHDSGLALYRSDTTSANPTERLTKALQGAHERYLATPESERVYSVEEALRGLALYVVVSIAISSRTQDSALSSSLPSILEPFALLSPALDAIWKNACASCALHCTGQYDLARELWLQVFAKLETIDRRELQHLEALSNAVAYALGVIEVQLGLPSAMTWAERLDQDPWQRVSALNLRQILRLEQGDSHGADRLRREAEVLSLQMQSPQMFNALCVVELAAHSRGRDLTGIAHVLEQIRPLAARYAGWAPCLINGEARFELVRGDFEAAKAKFEACIALTEPEGKSVSRSMSMWINSHAGLAETLLATDRAEAARDTASRALARCEAKSHLGVWSEVVRMLALAEAKLGDPRGIARLDALIADQQQSGTSGLWLGLSYEARAQIAIWTEDAAAFAHYARLTAREYRYGARSPLAARYERLMNEASRHGLRATASLADYASMLTSASTGIGGDEDSVTIVMRSMANKPVAQERARMALQLACVAHDVTAGHLYLLTETGLTLCASHGVEPPDAALTSAVQALVASERRRASELDEMATGELEDESALSNTVAVAGASYALRMLTCVIDDVGTLAGVVAFDATAAQARTERQTQLLKALALYLIRAGDSTGLRLSS
jgi:hypothetical protein